jgi:hypothetical protein
MRRRVAIASLGLLVWSSNLFAADEPVACSASDRETYLSEIREKLYENWKVPYQNRTIACTLLIKQNFRGEVLFVGIAKCTDDVQIHKSAINAAYQASPMPLPENRDCFRRDTIVRIESRAQAAD